MMGIYNNNVARNTQTQPPAMAVPSLLIKYVDHTYRDYSRYVEEGGELIKHKKCGNNFPARLHRMLSDAAALDQYSDIITWMPHGRAWKILDRNRLVSEVLPKYYVCKKYESFGRQLNGWGFKRLHRTGTDFGCYYHECFLKDMPELTCLIRRLPTNLGKSMPFAEGEPNFYRISKDFPLPPPSKETSKAVMPRARAASISTISEDAPVGASTAIPPSRARSVSLSVTSRARAASFSTSSDGGSDPTREIRDRSTMTTMARPLVEEIGVPEAVARTSSAPVAIHLPSFRSKHQMAVPEAAARATSAPTPYDSRHHGVVKVSDNVCHPTPWSTHHGHTNHQPPPYPTSCGPSSFYQHPREYYNHYQEQGHGYGGYHEPPPPPLSQYHHPPFDVPNPRPSYHFPHLPNEVPNEGRLRHHFVPSPQDDRVSTYPRDYHPRDIGSDAPPSSLLSGSHVNCLAYPGSNDCSIKHQLEPPPHARQKNVAHDPFEPIPLSHSLSIQEGEEQLASTDKTNKAVEARIVREEADKNNKNLFVRGAVEAQVVHRMIPPSPPLVKRVDEHQIAIETRAPERKIIDTKKEKVVETPVVHEMKIDWANGW